MIKALKPTTNFLIKYNSKFHDGLRRAKAVRSSCESDFAQLRAWFKSSGGFGTKNRVTVLIDKASDGSNNGYHKGGGSSMTITPFNLSPNKSLADDGTRAVFVAELTEILMDYQNQQTGTTTWHPRWSDGEGLSRVSAALLYKDAYYQMIHAPFINPWLGLKNRPDFVSKNQKSDVKVDSFGCSILFIYYLYSQLGIDLVSIVSKAGATLDDTYKAVTGKTGGYKAFTDLLAKFYPIADTPYLPFDDPFPLVDGSQRSVTVTMTEKPYAPSPSSTSGSATFNACGNGPTSKYKWTLKDEYQYLYCVAHVEGFAQPVYSWKINGQPVLGAASVVVKAIVLRDNPSDPAHPSSSTQTVTLEFSTGPGSGTYNGLTDEMIIANQDFPGHVLLTIEADVTESYGSSDVTSGLGVGTLDTQKLSYDKKYYKDLALCRNYWQREFGPLTVLAPWVTLLLTLPDPAPEVMNGAAVLVAVGNEIAAISANDPVMGAQVAAVVARILNVPVGMLGAVVTGAGG